MWYLDKKPTFPKENPFTCSFVCSLIHSLFNNYLQSTRYLLGFDLIIKIQQWTSHNLSLKFLKNFIYLLFRESRREEEREGEKDQCARDISIGCLLHAPSWGTWLQPTHVPYLGMEKATFQSTGCCSIHWATTARAKIYWLINFLQKKEQREIEREKY